MVLITSGFYGFSLSGMLCMCVYFYFLFTGFSSFFG